MKQKKSSLIAFITLVGSIVSILTYMNIELEYFIYETGTKQVIDEGRQVISSSDESANNDGSSVVSPSRSADPTVSIEVSKILNGKSVPGSTTDELVLVKSLLDAGLSVSRDRTSISKLHIPVEIQITTIHSTAFDSFSSDCTVNYEVIDTGRKSLVNANSLTVGPVAGFLSVDTEKSCVEQLLDRIANSLANEVKNNI